MDCVIMSYHIKNLQRGRVSTAVQHEVAQVHRPDHANSVHCPPNHWQQTADKLSNFHEGWWKFLQVVCAHNKQNNKTTIQKKGGSLALYQWLLYIYLHLTVTFTSTNHILWNIFQSLLPHPHNTVAILNSTMIHYKLNLWKCLTQNHCQQQKTN